MKVGRKNKEHDAAVKKELEMLATRGKGIVKPEAVVAFARNPETALHSQFEWNDSAAAEQYRIEQARTLLRVIVHEVPGSGQRVPVFVSLQSDRTEGGYRRTVDVLSDADMKRQLMDQLKREARAWAKRAADFAEFADAVSAIKKVA